MPPLPIGSPSELRVYNAGITANELTVALGEIATLDHKGLDDTVEGRALITESLLASCQSTERSPESASRAPLDPSCR